MKLSILTPVCLVGAKIAKMAWDEPNGRCWLTVTILDEQHSPAPKMHYFRCLLVASNGGMEKLKGVWKTGDLVSIQGSLFTHPKEFGKHIENQVFVLVSKMQKHLT